MSTIARLPECQGNLSQEVQGCSKVYSQHDAASFLSNLSSGSFSANVRTCVSGLDEAK